jgi:cytochrome c-type biogenesis protein CcmH/NrfG
MFLIDDLLFAPISGFKFVLRTLEKVAQEQYTDDAPLKERLLELQLLLDNGEITEDEYGKQEAAIFRELREIENRKREVAGAPPLEERGPLSGRVVEGSGAEITFNPDEHNYE